MEDLSQEFKPADPVDAYERNRVVLLELMGRINARLAAKYRTDQPREWEHVGEQEETIAMLRHVAEFLDA